MFSDLVKRKMHRCVWIFVCETDDSAASALPVARTQFQSTPGSEEPGDMQSAIALIPRRTCFNPRPAPRSRATSGLPRFLIPALFQSTPGSEEPGDAGESR